VPYCTGDVHIGNTTRRYARGLTVHHKGYVNGTAALDRLADAFPAATDVVVAGESAGSVAAPLYAGLASDLLPRARITALADRSGSYPDLPGPNRIIAGWGAGHRTFPRLFIDSGRHHPKIVFARRDFARDAEQRGWYPLAGIPVQDVLSLMDRNERQIERAGVNLRSYTAPGDEHTTLTDGTFYTEEVDGEPLADWVTGLVAGEPVPDVRGVP
jgi:hypothetical protein